MIEEGLEVPVGEFVGVLVVVFVGTGVSVMVEVLVQGVPFLKHGVH